MRTNNINGNQKTFEILSSNIQKVILGKQNSVTYALITLLCRGHLLIDDVPGLGKTILARAICKSLALDFKRIQCTPDLLPADITGVSIYNQKTSGFEFIRGPIFTNILLADEINRTTPRTQSALMECMAEQQVTVDSETYRLDDPFMVIATQNPVEFHGTFPLPEAQLDRFFMCIDMGYPNEEDELDLMTMQIGEHPIHSLQSVLEKKQLTELQDQVTQIKIHPDLIKYIASIVRATRVHNEVLLGASPRGSIALMKASQALALINGQDYVTPMIVKQVAAPVLSHRLILKQHSQISDKHSENVVKSILDNTPVPTIKQPAGS